MTKTLAIGLDGATWTLLNPWIEQGILPNLKKIINGGTIGNLESTIPPVTAPVWISYATGKNPGKHGCYDFVYANKTLCDLKVISTKNINGKTFYEILKNYKKKIILINLPGSYPPLTDEITITSLMTKGDNCVFPPTLLDEIHSFKQYRISPNMGLALNHKTNEFIEDIRKLEHNRFKCAKELFIKEWDFFFILFSGTDWIQHEFYNKLKRNKPEDISEYIELYIEIDRYIGWFFTQCECETNIILMSDHGFKEYVGCFFINEWLKHEGYLHVKKRMTKTETFLTAESASKAKQMKTNIALPNFLMSRLSLFKAFVPLYRHIKKIIPIEMNFDFMPNLDKSIAYCTTNELRGIYINSELKFVNGIVKQDEYEKIRDEIILKIKSLKSPKNGNTLFKSVKKKEDVYFGEMQDNAPDIILELDEYTISSDLHPSIFENKFTKPCNQHDPNGIFLAHGPDIKQNATIEGARIIDLAPTILHMYGVPIPRDMDGRVLTEIFREDSEMAQREIVYEEDKTKAEKDKAALKNRIGKLKQKKKI